nr:uncharacterized protein LOC127319686 [Lolium perenne]XP_051205708.1 uncharacterized protein LOC127319686 [Lolium perenne]
MVALLRQGLTRIDGSVLQRTQAVVTSSAGHARRLLVPRRRMLSTDKEQSKNLKLPHQVLWELIKIFPGQKVFNLVAVATVAVMIASTGSQVEEAEKKQEKVMEGEKKQSK